MLVEMLLLGLCSCVRRPHAYNYHYHYYTLLMILLLLPLLIELMTLLLRIFRHGSHYRADTSMIGVSTVCDIGTTHV